MSFLRTRSGEIWGTPAQIAAVEKAARISAEKRRKFHPPKQNLSRPHPMEAEELRGLQKIIAQNPNGLAAKLARERINAMRGPTPSAPTTNSAAPKLAPKPSTPAPKSPASGGTAEEFKARVAARRESDTAAAVANGNATAKLVRSPGGGSPVITPETADDVIAAQQQRLARAKADSTNKSIAPGSRRVAKQHAEDAARLIETAQAVQANHHAGLPPTASSAEVIARAAHFPNQDAYSAALNLARRRERIAAGGPATVPKGKVLGADGKLRNATPKSTDILVGGKVHAPNEIPADTKAPQLESERLQARIDALKRELENPDLTGASTAALRQSRIDGIRQNINYLNKRRRTALGNEQTAEMNRRLAARTPEQKAADAAAEAERGRAAQIAKLEKTIRDSPGSWAAKMAQEKLDAIKPPAVADDAAKKQEAADALRAIRQGPVAGIKRPAQSTHAGFKKGDLVVFQAPRMDYSGINPQQGDQIVVGRVTSATRDGKVKAFQDLAYPTSAPTVVRKDTYGRAGVTAHKLETEFNDADAIAAYVANRPWSHDPTKVGAPFRTMDEVRSELKQFNKGFPKSDINKAPPEAKIQAILKRSKGQAKPAETPPAATQFIKGDVVQIGNGSQRWTIRRIDGDIATVTGDPTHAVMAGGQTQTRRVPLSKLGGHWEKAERPQAPEQAPEQTLRRGLTADDLREMNRHNRESSIKSAERELLTGTTRQQRAEASKRYERLTGKRHSNHVEAQDVFTFELPNGKTVTRKSANPITHAIVRTLPANHWSNPGGQIIPPAGGLHTSLADAEAAARNDVASYNTKVVPVSLVNDELPADPRRRNNGRGSQGHATKQEMYNSRRVHAPDKWKSGKGSQQTKQAARDAGWTVTDHESGMRETTFRKGDVQMSLSYSEVGNVTHGSVINAKTRQPIAVIGSGSKNKMDLIRRFLNTLGAG